MNVGETLNDRYCLEELLHQSQWSSAYRATDTKENKSVLLKLFHPEHSNPEDLLRLKRETHILLHLSHPGIIKLLDLGEINGRPFLVTEYLTGKTLRETLSQKRPSLKEVIDWGAQMSRAIAHFHRNGIIHRDLKPENIVLEEKTSTIKILDFGLARLLTLNDYLEETALVGSLIYMSPEQTGVLRRHADARSDLYSLGIILYEALTGSPPFVSQDAGTLIHYHLAKLPAPIAEKNDSVPPQLEKMIFKLLAKDPSDRYQTAEGFLHDLSFFISKIQEGKQLETFPLGITDHIGRLIFHPPLMGRTQQMASLRARVNRLSESRGDVVFLIGDGGIGKTRLIDELRPYAALNKAIVISGKCHQLLTRFPYAPLQEALREYVHFFLSLPSTQQQSIRQALTEALEELSSLIVEFAPEFKTIFGEKLPPLPPFPPDKARQRLFQCVNTLWEAITSVHPLILFLDDMHWIDRESLELLQTTLPKLQNFPLLIIGAYRLAEEPEWLESFSRQLTPFETDHQIQLLPLSQADVRSLLQDMLAIGAPWVDTLSEKIHSQSAGNPLYITQILRTIFEEKVISLDHERWEFDASKLSKIPFPEEIFPLIINRFDRLTAPTKQALCTAAAIGREWSADLLYKIIPDREQLFEAMEEGKLAQFIEESPLKGETYNFSHDQAREAIYKKIPPTEKEVLHRKIGKALEEKAEQAGSMIIYELAHHFYCAREPEKILRYSLRAAKMAALTYAAQQSIIFYDQALALTEESHLKDEILEEKADINILTGDYAKSEEIYLDLLSRKTDIWVLDKCRLHRKLGDIYFRKGVLHQAAAHLEEALKLLGNPVPKTRFGVYSCIVKQSLIQLAHGWFPLLFVERKRASAKAQILHERQKIYGLLSYVYWFTDFLKMYRTNLLAVNIAESLGDPREMGHAYSQHCVAVSTIPLLKRAIRFGIASLRLREKLGDQWGIAQSHAYLGMIYHSMGEIEKALDHLHKANKGFVKTGDLWERQNAVVHLGMCYQLKGDLRQAAHYFKITTEIATQVNDLSFLGKTASFMGQTKALIGAASEGQQYISKALECVEKTKDPMGQTIVANNASGFYLIIKDFDKVIEQAEMGIELCKKFKINVTYVRDLYLNLAEAILAKWQEQKSEILKKKFKKITKEVTRLTHYPNQAGHAYRVYAEILLALGNKEDAERALKKSIDLLKKLGDLYHLARSYYLLAQILIDRNDPQFKTYLLLAKDLFEQCRARHDLIDLCQRYGALIESKDMQLEVSRRRRLGTVIKVSGFLSSIRDLPTLLTKMMDAVIALFGAERGVVLLKDDRGDLQVRVTEHVGANQVQQSEEFSLSRKIIQKVFSEGKGLVVINAQADTTFKKEDSVIKYGLRSVLCVPLKVKEEILGVIYLDNRLVTNLFSGADLELLNVFATQAAIAVQNALVFYEIRKLNQELEQKVAERTKDLVQTQEELKQKIVTIEEAHEKLTKLDALKVHFFALCSHNLKNPITIIRNSIDALENTPREVRQKFMKMISRQTDRMLRLLDQLLQITQLDYEEFPINQKNIVLTDLITGVFQDIQLQAKAKKIQTHLDLKNIPHISCDPERIREVIENLVSNAFKFTPEQGRITISTKVVTEDDTEFAEVSVVDTGRGISDDKLPHLFQRFQHMGEPKDEEKGAGLGLFLCKQIVELHGGKIWVESKIGQGSKFYFRLPTRPAEKIKKAA